MMTPIQIVRQLDQHVVGQADAKKILAVAVYSHFRKSAKALSDSVELVKSNILLIGSTGTGKTLLCETLSRILGAPFVTADATTLAQSEFVNNEIEAILQRLLDKADGDVSRAQRGLVFIDEVDKLKAVSGRSRAASGESVQHALLKIMEGSQVRLKSGNYIDTTHILFICGGAFVGLWKSSRTRRPTVFCRSPKTTTRRSSTGSMRGSSLRIFSPMAWSRNLPVDCR